MNHSKVLIIFFLFFLSTTLASSSNIHKCRKGQSEALLSFKQNLSDINNEDFAVYCDRLLGSSYHPMMMNWETSTDCCKWDGVTCDLSTGDVIGIDVSCGMLQGIIYPNSSLFDLPHLQKLNLAYNTFDGSHIPSKIGRFSNSLTHFNLSGCSFIGQVPLDITFLHKLVSLDLSSNIDLNLRPNVFINLIRNVTNLEELSLGNVNISSILPMSLNMSSLKLLDLYNTNMQGKLPHYIFNFHYLETLDLRYNSFTGDIPLEISDNLTHLTSMKLAYNKLNGTVPSWLFNSPSLEYLSLNDNMLGGDVPFESIRKLTNLTVLDLSHNNLSGEWELDTLLTSLANLEYLDLSHNDFSITSQTANHYVNPAFRYLGLASCKLKVFPNSIRPMKQLAELDLSSNEIHGQIPHWVGEIGGNKLYRLNLSHNFITGLSQFQLYGLQYLSLKSNMIQGPFPPSICNMSRLASLDVSNNRFDGLIPQCFGDMVSFLEMINMGNNSFQGTIPNIHGGCRLTGLSLNGNQLRGEVPISFSKCQYLNVFDFGNNHLNGTFPDWLGEIPNLQVLVLKSNNFHGRIQPSLTVEFPFPSLLVLDLSHNGFEGRLPAKYFQNLNAMKNVVKSSTTPQYVNMGSQYYSFVVAVKGVNQVFSQISVYYTIIQLSSNKFEGEIPNVLGGLNSLIVLNLSHNCLKGPISHALGDLIEIQSLDLSWNQLSGEIPQSLARINTLAVLNLSQNRLVGRIPNGAQFNTFEDKSFEGNPGLCGLPLTKTCGKHIQNPQLETHEEESGFTWKVVTLGYGCGTLLGLVIGYLMLSTRKVKWFNVISDGGAHMILARNKRRYVYIGK